MWLLFLSTWAMLPELKKIELNWIIQKCFTLFTAKNEWYGIPVVFMILLKNKWQTRQEKSKWTNLKQFTFSRICECRTHLFIFAHSICTVLKILTHAADCCTKEVILCSMSQQCIVHWWAAKLYKAQRMQTALTLTDIVHQQQKTQKVENCVKAFATKI